MNVTDTPTVYVVDDDEAVRDSLGWLIESVGMPVRTFGSADDFLDSYEPEMCGCLLVDVRMPGTGGLELQEALRQRDIPLPVVIITGHGDVPMAVRAMKAGAVDFVQKPFNDQMLLDAIRKAMEQAMRHRRAVEERRDAEQRFAHLTPRERDVLALVVEGRPNKLIARELGIAEKTVEVHRGRIMRKTGAHSVAELVRWSLRRGAAPGAVPAA